MCIWLQSLCVHHSIMLLPSVLISPSRTGFYDYMRIQQGILNSILYWLSTYPWLWGLERDCSASCSGPLVSEPFAVGLQNWLFWCRRIISAKVSWTSATVLCEFWKLACFSEKSSLQVFSIRSLSSVSLMSSSGGLLGSSWEAWGSVSSGLALSKFWLCSTEVVLLWAALTQTLDSGQGLERDHQNSYRRP